MATTTEGFKRRKGVLFARPYQIDVAFSGTPPETVMFSGIAYSDPKPVKDTIFIGKFKTISDRPLDPSGTQGQTGKTVYRFTMVTKPNPTFSQPGLAGEMPGMKPVLPEPPIPKKPVINNLNLSKSNVNRPPQPPTTIVDNFFTGVSTFWSELTGVEKPNPNPLNTPIKKQCWIPYQKIGDKEYPGHYADCGNSF